MIDRETRKKLVERFDTAFGQCRAKWANADDGFDAAADELIAAIEGLRTNQLKIVPDKSLQERRLNEIAILEDAKQRANERNQVK